MWLSSRVPRPRRGHSLPHGWKDLSCQLLLFTGVYLVYQLVSGLVSAGDGYKPFGDATTIINLERALHVFVEPSIQAWAMRTRWLMDLADWSYLNAHYLVTPAALLFIYLRRHDSFDFVRNMFIAAMAIALVGYTAFPTAPPRLMPEWGFTDSISQFLHASGSIDDGPARLFVNFYAAVPSMHVCMAAMIGLAMFQQSRHAGAKIAWSLYPVWITFVVIATGNHYLTDIVLGILTAALAAAVGHAATRAKPDSRTLVFRQALRGRPTNRGPRFEAATEKSAADSRACERPREPQNSRADEAIGARTCVPPCPRRDCGVVPRRNHLCLLMRAYRSS
jgi:hypothetical protein